MDKRAFELFQLYILSKAYLSDKNKTRWKKGIFTYGKLGFKNVKYSTFESYNPIQRRYFYLFSKKSIHDEQFLRICACAYNFIGHRFLPMQLIEDQTIELYKKIQEYLENFEEYAKVELDRLGNINLLSKGINYPQLLEAYIQKKISLPLVIALERKHHVLEKFNNLNIFSTAMKMIWESHYVKIHKWDTFFFNDLPDL